MLCWMGSSLHWGRRKRSFLSSGRGCSYFTHIQWQMPNWRETAVFLTWRREASTWSFVSALLQNWGDFVQVPESRLTFRGENKLYLVLVGLRENMENIMDLPKQSDLFMAINRKWTQWSSCATLISHWPSTDKCRKCILYHSSPHFILGTTPGEKDPLWGLSPHICSRSLILESRWKGSIHHLQPTDHYLRTTLAMDQPADYGVH